MSKAVGKGGNQVPQGPMVGYRLVNGHKVPISTIEQRQADYQMELEDAGMTFTDEVGIVRNPLHQATVVIVAESYRGMRLAFRELDPTTHRASMVRVIVPGQLDSIAPMAEWITALCKIKQRREQIDASDEFIHGKQRYQRRRDAVGKFR